MKKTLVKSNNNNGNQESIITIVIIKAYLKHVLEQKDLGVILGVELQLEHISVKMKEANAKLELI